LTVIGHRQFPHGPGTAQAAPVSCRRQRQHLAGLRVMQHGRPGQWDDYRDPVVVRLRELGIATVYKLSTGQGAA